MSELSEVVALDVFFQLPVSLVHLILLILMGTINCIFREQSFSVACLIMTRRFAFLRTLLVDLSTFSSKVKKNFYSLKNTAQNGRPKADQEITRKKILPLNLGSIAL